jgi:hypothetical protein
VVSRDKHRYEHDQLLNNVASLQLNEQQKANSQMTMAKQMVKENFN